MKSLLAITLAVIVCCSILWVWSYVSAFDYNGYPDGLPFTLMMRQGVIELGVRRTVFVVPWSAVFTVPLLAFVSLMTVAIIRARKSANRKIEGFRLNSTEEPPEEKRGTF